MDPLSSRPLLALLILADSLLSQESNGDSPSCTGDPLTVLKGQPAVMFCATSTPLSHVAIRLSTPGKASRLIFGEDGPGNFSNGGWRLEVRGGEARLVIPNAQPAQAGEYTWYLVGTHGSVGHTRLSVSGLSTLSAPQPPQIQSVVPAFLLLPRPDPIPVQLGPSPLTLDCPEPLITEEMSTPPTAPGTWPPPPASTMFPVPVLVVLAIIVPVLLFALLAWRRRRCSRHMRRILQVSESAASRSPLQEEADAAVAAVPRVRLSGQDTNSLRLQSEAPRGDSGL